jgi:small-conductance mechanosensitive channel
VHRILGASVAPFVATSELLAFAILAITVHLLWRVARAKFGAVQTELAGTQRGWLRAILWLCSIAMALGLATGYVGFAVFVATRMLAAFAVGGAVFILIAMIDAALTDLLAAGTPGGRSIAMALGLTPRGLDLVATLASALLRLVIAALAVLLALNASGIFTDDIFSAMQRTVSDYDIGAVHVSPVTILSALACLVIGGLAVRAAQRWLTVKFLPRTALEPGLQNSIVALSGYFALIVVVAVFLGILGIDLQKIALIAGALSVGIGFGLQSVVSNFVSGLILLAERSIRVGDWVVVKNEEGFVRRISIRATEIETFDRASVIIPNQDFITGLVKNWTHSNTVGRVIVKVRVAFDSDVMRVRELLLEAGVKHPQVLPGTPSVFLLGFGDIGIDFELICLIGNVSQGMTVRSDLYMDILERFRDARIKIPAPIHEVNVPTLPAPPQAAASKIA